MQAAIQLQKTDIPQAVAAVGTVRLAISETLLCRVVVTKFGARQEAGSSSAVGPVIFLYA